MSGLIVHDITFTYESASGTKHFFLDSLLIDETQTYNLTITESAGGLASTYVASFQIQYFIDTVLFNITHDHGAEFNSNGTYYNHRAILSNNQETLITIDSSGYRITD